MKREKKKEKIAKIIQGQVGFFNGWLVEEDREYLACEKAAVKIMKMFNLTPAKKKLK